ncbi:glycolate oxidase subunit GlcE [Chelatococcus reniformis]|uniref:2-hydroxy-acid oxidase n=1 Tax=Chelatococcus reniformis TaxID=1494448 RepID=A0A916U425_9HYPH|nr:glycolate oxidase subunit GlcE [Chelatococcus reniformis]GGC59881.1 2-hydroxy-acid oxidase [Chelatococcus reniformis]
MPMLAPTTSAELADAIAGAAADGTRLEIRGGGSKAGVGTGGRQTAVLDMRGFAGIIDYDPAELVLTVGAGTPLAEVETLVAAHGQMLAFEPFDHGPLFGRPVGAATIGGIVAAGVAGSRRPVMGGVRDHLLRFEGVSGRGEPFMAGAKVVKNVTGYDLPKLMCGSWGRLAALTQVTLKVLPAPRETTSCLVRGLDPRQACAVMARAMGSQAEPSAAIHIPGRARGASLTVLRLQGFGPSVAARAALLERLLGEHVVETPDAALAEAIWGDVRTLAPMNDGRPLWRLSIAAGAAPAVIAALEPLGAQWQMDWAGSLIWLCFDGGGELVRRTAAGAGGHAMLVRDDRGVYAGMPTFQPQAAVLAALETRVRRAFDPAGVFETGRFSDLAPHLDLAHAD